jgi:hypothetical protein
MCILCRYSYFFYNVLRFCAYSYSLEMYRVAASGGLPDGMNSLALLLEEGRGMYMFIVYTCISIYIYIHIYVCKCINRCIHVFIYVYLYTYIHV